MESLFHSGKAHHTHIDLDGEQQEQVCALATELQSSPQNVDYCMYIGAQSVSIQRTYERRVSTANAKRRRRNDHSFHLQQRTIVVLSLSLFLRRGTKLPRSEALYHHQYKRRGIEYSILQILYHSITPTHSLQWTIVSATVHIDTQRSESRKQPPPPRE
jgi:hypothetical protein